MAREKGRGVHSHHYHNRIQSGRMHDTASNFQLALLSHQSGQKICSRYLRTQLRPVIPAMHSIHIGVYLSIVIAYSNAKV